MAQVFRFRPPQHRRRGFLTLDRLAALAFVLGAVVTWLAAYVPGVSGLSLLLGLGAAFVVYASFHDHAR